jgi:hypothetical protein
MTCTLGGVGEGAGVSRGLRWGAAAAAGLVVLFLAGFGGANASSEARQGGGGSSTKALRRLLRLHDLPLGYLVLRTAFTEITLPSIGCEEIDPAEPQPRLAEFLDRYSPSGCLAIYMRLFRVPGQGPYPLIAASGAVELQSVEAAEMGLAVSRELLGHLLEDRPPTEVPPPEVVGDASRLFRWEGGSLFGGGPDEKPSSFLVWRSGRVVAVTFASGYRSPPSEHAAVELAQLQQKHLETPTPYTRAEMDDTEVALEDPALEVPVYWLGRRLTGRHGMPPLRLRESVSTTSSAPREARVSIFYTAHLDDGRSEGVEIDLWSPRQWKQLAAKGRSPGDLRCRKSRRVELAQGRAIVYSGLEGRRGSCAKRHRVYTARLYLPGVIATVETSSFCAVCFGAGAGPYDSPAGMKAIVHTLHLRP